MFYFLRHRRHLSTLKCSSQTSFLISRLLEKSPQGRLGCIKLPDLSSNSTNVALDLSVQATASAFCAIEAANLAVLREAYGLYGKTLAAHSTLLMLED